MPTAENALIKLETGQTAHAMEALADTGDAQSFSGSAAPWSKVPGFTPVIRPDGVLTGAALTPSAGNDAVDAAALTCYLAGVETAVAAEADLALTRPAADVAKVNSITVDNTGAFAVVVGTDGATAAFSEVRGAAGGPPLIPVGSIEVGQVRLTTSAAAVVASAEVFQLAGTHKEMALAPGWSTNYFDGQVKFTTALPKIHTGTLPKAVYASFSTPEFADLEKTVDFVAPEESYSVSSTQYYGGTEASESKSLGQGKFKAFLSDGITDELVSARGVPRWLKFYPDRYLPAHHLCNGKIGLTREWKPASPNAATCTITATEAGREVAG